MRRSVSATMAVVFCFTLLFLFLPVGIDEDTVTKDFLATYSYKASGGNTQSELLSPYIDVGTMDSKSNPEIKTITSKVTGFTREILEVCEVSNISGRGIRQKPVDGSYTSMFNVTRAINGGYQHSGTDIAYSTDKCTWCLAPFSGTVVEDVNNTGYGRRVTVESDQFPGLCFLYAHMAPGNASSHGGTQPSWQTNLSGDLNKPIGSGYAGGTVQVKLGDHVNAGQRIGIMGTTGPSTGVHLHFELQLHVKDSKIVPYAQAPSGNCYRASAYKWLTGTELSDLEWFYSYYDGDGWIMGNTLSSNEVNLLSAIDVSDADVGGTD